MNEEQSVWNLENIGLRERAIILHYGLGDKESLYRMEEGYN